MACGQAWSNFSSSPSPAIVDCGALTITAVIFAYYGNPQGSCWAATRGTCNSGTALATITTACVGRSFCIVVRPPLLCGLLTFGAAASPIGLAMAVSVATNRSDGARDL